MWVIYICFCLFQLWLANKTGHSKKEWFMVIYEAYLGYLGLNLILAEGLDNLILWLIDGHSIAYTSTHLGILLMIFIIDIVLMIHKEEFNRNMCVHHVIGIVSMIVLLSSPNNIQSMLFLIVHVELTNPLYYGYLIAQKIKYEKVYPQGLWFVSIIENIFLVSFFIRYGFMVYLVYGTIRLIPYQYWYLHLFTSSILIVNTFWFYGGIKKVIRKFN